MAPPSAETVGLQSCSNWVCPPRDQDSKLQAAAVTSMGETTPAAVARELTERGNEQVIKRAIQTPKNEAVLRHLATNADTRAKVAAYVRDNLDECFTNMLERSDPQLVALGMLAQREASVRPGVFTKLRQTVPDVPSGLNVLARLATVAEIPADFIPLVAPYCDRRGATETVALAAVVLASMLPRCEGQLLKYVESALAKDDPSSVIKAFSVIAVTSSVDPSVGYRMFSAPAVLNSTSSRNFSDGDVVLACLEMLSSVCVVKEARSLAQSHYGKLLDTTLSSNQPEVKVLASAVKVKLLASGVADDFNAKSAASKIDELSVRFENYIEGTSKPSLPVLAAAVEGLATSSLLPSVRMRATLGLVTALAKIIEGSEGSAVYGALCTLANFTEYPYKETQEQKKMRELKAKAGPSAFEVQEALTPDEVLPLVDLVLETHIVEQLAQVSPRFSINSREQTAVLLRNMASQQKRATRIEIAVQGGVVVPVYLWVCDKDGQKLNDQYKSIAAAAISKLLAQVPPEVAFNERFKPEVSVRILGTQINSTHAVRKNLDTFEALLALTNLASIDDDDLRTAIVSMCWSKVEECLSTEFTQIQVATLELICNLTSSPACAAKFLQGDEHSKYLLSVLGKCLDIPVRKGRIAAAAAIANLAEWETAAEAVGHTEDIMDGIISSLDDAEDRDMLLRVLTALNTLVNDLLERGDDEAAEALIHHGGISKLERLVEVVDPHDKAITDLLVRILKMLAQYKLREVSYVRTQNYVPPPKSGLLE